MSHPYTYGFGSRLSKAYTNGVKGMKPPCTVSKGTPAYKAYQVGRQEFLKKEVHTMYAWSHSFNSVEEATEWLEREVDVKFNGLGFYLEDNETGLLTISDKDGERAVGKISGTNYRLNYYVFNVPFHKTIFSLTCRTASDNRS